MSQTPSDRPTNIRPDERRSQGELIEEWPWHNNIGIKQSGPQKKVNFSKHSTLKIYHKDPFYRANKSYSSADRRLFREEVVNEASRIHERITSLQLKPGVALRHLVNVKVLTCEELLGIEQLLVSRNTRKLINERKAHASFVLEAQKYLRETSAGDKVEMLGKASARSSAKSAKHASLRALLAV